MLQLYSATGPCRPTEYKQGLTEILISVALALKCGVLTQQSKMAGTQSYFYSNNVRGTDKFSTGHTLSRPPTLDPAVAGGGSQQDDHLPTTH